jgi:hypothetical protein
MKCKIANMIAAMRKKLATIASNINNHLKFWIDFAV